MISAEDRAILRYGQTPNVIVTGDSAGGALQDCAACGAYSRARWTAYAPSMNRDGYRVVGICSHCASEYIRDGRAIDRRG